MTTATLPMSGSPARAASDRKGWFKRALDRTVEARMRQAEFHVQQHLAQLAPELTEQRNYKEAVGDRWTLPFVR